MRWTAIGSGLFCPVAVCPKSEHITLFARGATGELLFKEWEGAEWSDFHSLGIPIAHRDASQGSVPAGWLFSACSGEPDRIDLVAGSPDGELLHMARTGGEWGAFECLGAQAMMRGSIAIPQIGRASGRERVQISVGHGEQKKNVKQQSKSKERNMTSRRQRTTK